MLSTWSLLEKHPWTRPKTLPLCQCCETVVSGALGAGLEPALSTVWDHSLLPQSSKTYTATA